MYFVTKQYFEPKKIRNFEAEIGKKMRNFSLKFELGFPTNRTSGAGPDYHIYTDNTNVLL